MTTESVDSLTIRYLEAGVEKVKEVDKVILAKGAWATILFCFQDLDVKTGVYGKKKFSLRRYRKLQGEYVMQSKFTISSVDQAQKLIDALTPWFADSSNDE